MTPPSRTSQITDVRPEQIPEVVNFVMQARAQMFPMLYLHTHPFLPGAISFWQRQGFTIVDIEDDPLWQTTHMQRVL